MALLGETDAANLQSLFVYLDSLNRDHSLQREEGSGAVRLDNLFSQFVQQAKNPDRPEVSAAVASIIEGYIRPPAAESRSKRKVKRGRKTQGARLRDVFDTSKGQLSSTAFRRALAVLGVQLPE